MMITVIKTAIGYYMIADGVKFISAPTLTPKNCTGCDFNGFDLADGCRIIFENETCSNEEIIWKKEK